MPFKRLFLILFQVFTVTMLFAQDILLERNIEMQVLFNEKRESYPVLNKDDETLALFLLDENTIQAQLLDKDLNRINSVADFRPKSGFTTLLGSNTNNGVYNLFFTNKKKNKFYCKTIDLVKGLHSDHEIPIKLKGEKYLECISYNNQFYLLTVAKSAPLLHLYIFENSYTYQVSDLDLSGFKLSVSGISTLYDILINGTNPYEISADFSKVDIQNPNSLDVTSKSNKLYSFDNKLIITFDNESHETKILTIDLTDYSCIFKTYKQGSISCGNAVVMGSNSYLYYNLLFQIKECSQELYFSVFDLTDGVLLNEYRVNKEEEIPFKNSPIFQEGGRNILQQNSKKELETTKVLLRKIAAGNTGLSVYPSAEFFVVTIGGYLEVQHLNSGGGMMMSSPGTYSMGSSGNFVSTPPTYYYNPTMYGYSSYKNSRSTYFKSVLDGITFDHCKREIIPNAFDKIKEFSEPIEKYIVSETIFKLRDFYVFGYYNTNEKKYYLRKFTD